MTYNSRNLLIFIILVHGSNQLKKIDKNEPSDVCLGCICEAATGCKSTLGCDTITCGMFAISKPYWEDAGNLILTGDDSKDPLAWKRCVMNPYCAGQTVIGYMKRFRKDCDNDRAITCLDYAHIHHHGQYACGNVLPENYRRMFNSCMQHAASAIKDVKKPTTNRHK